MKMLYIIIIALMLTGIVGASFIYSPQVLSTLQQINPFSEDMELEQAQSPDLGSVSITENRILKLNKKVGLEKWLIDNVDWNIDDTNVYINLTINVTVYNWMKDTYQNPTMTKCLQAEPYIQEDYPAFDCNNADHRQQALTKFENFVRQGFKIITNGIDRGYINRTGNIVHITIPLSYLERKDLIELGESSLVYEYEEEASIFYDFETGNITLALINKDIPENMNNISIETINDTYKFSGFDNYAVNDTQLFNYTYILNSTNLIRRFRNGIEVYEGNECEGYLCGEKHFFDFEDVCSRQFNPHLVFYNQSYLNESIPECLNDSIDFEPPEYCFYYIEKNRTEYTKANCEFIINRDSAVINFISNREIDPSATWFNSSWTYRKQINISNSNVDSDLSDFPVLVKFVSDDDISANALSNGHDIRFANHSGSELSYEREFFNGSDGYFWVKADVDADAPTDIYIYYGNETASAGADGQDISNVWDSNYKGVYHMNGTGDSSGAWKDSSGSGNHFTAAAGTPDYQQAGKIGEGVNLVSGSNEYFVTEDMLGFTNWPMTLSVWFSPDSYINQVLISSGDGFSNNDYLDIALRDPADDDLYISTRVSASTESDIVPGTYSLGSWQFGAGRWVGDQNRTAWRDIATITDTSNSKGWPNGQDYFRIGNIMRTNNNQPFDGLLDEVRISNIARSNDWIKFEFYNINSTNNELTFGSEESEAPPDDSPVSYLISPANATNYTADTIVTFTCNATDDYNLENATLYVNNPDFSINHTNFTTWNGTSNSTSFTFNFTADGLYTWNCLVYDNASQSDWYDTNWTVNITTPIAPDTIYPIFSAPTEDPTDAATYSYNQLYTFNITINNSNGTAWIRFNSNNYTASNLSHYIYNYSVLNLGVGNYTYNWSAYGNGTSNNFNMSNQYTYNITRTIPTGNLTNTTALTVEYPNPVNINYEEGQDGDSDVTYIMYRDGDDVSAEAGNNVVLGAGSYTYVLNTTGGANYSINASMDTFTVTVNQNDTYDLTLTGTTPIIYGNAGDFEGTGCLAELTCNLYRNDTSVSNPDTTVLGAGAYNYTYNTTGNTNYSSKQISSDLVVNQNGSIVTLSLNGTEGNVSIFRNENLWLNGTTITGEGNILLYNNGSLINNGSSPIANLTSFDDFGFYNITVIHPETQNYTQNSTTWWVEATDNIYPSFVSLTESPTDPATFSIGQNYFFNATVKDTNGSVILAFNGTNYTASNLSATLYNVTINNLGAGNYTYYWSGFSNGTLHNYNSTATYSYNISRTSAQTGISFDLASPQEYPEAVTPTCSVLTGEGSAVLKYNGTTITSGNPYVFGTGNWTFNCSITETQNYTYAENVTYFIISQNNTFDLSLTGTTPIIYGTAGDFEGTNCPAELTCNLYRNDTSVSNPDTTVLGAGAYNYTYNTTGNTNYSTNQISSDLTVNQNGSIVILSLNGTEGNITIEEGENVWLNGTTQTGEGNILLYNNGSLINNGSSPIANLTNFATVGFYNITIVHPVTQNYTGNRTIWWVNVGDIIYPEITITSPTNTTYSTNISFINYTYTENNPDKCWYYNGSVNSTPVTMGTNWSGVVSYEGSNTRTVWCNDTSNNLNSSSVTFFKDTIYPEINITYPVNTSYTESVLSLNYTYTETNCNKVWYNNGTANSSLQSCGTNWSVTANEGDNNWTVWINDSANNLNYSEVYFYVDTINPELNITYPLNTTYVTNVSFLNYTYTEINCNSAWYNNGSANFTPVSCGNNFSNVMSYEGNNIWTVWINDSLNNLNSSSVTFFKDTVYPSVAVSTGKSDLKYTNNITPTVYANITGYDNVSANIWAIINDESTEMQNSSWREWYYELNGGSWEYKHTIQVCANDTAQNTNCSSEYWTWIMGNGTLDLNITSMPSSKGVNVGWDLNFTVNCTTHNCLNVNYTVDFSPAGCTLVEVQEVEISQEEAYDSDNTNYFLYDSTIFSHRYSCTTASTYNFSILFQSPYTSNFTSQTIDITAGAGGYNCDIRASSSRVNRTAIIVSTAVLGSDGTPTDKTLESNCYDLSGNALSGLTFTKLTTGEYYSVYNTTDDGVCYIVDDSDECGFDSISWSDYYGNATASDDEEEEATGLDVDDMYIAFNYDMSELNRGDMRFSYGWEY